MVNRNTIEISSSSKLTLRSSAYIWGNVTLGCGDSEYYILAVKNKLCSTWLDTTGLAEVAQLKWFWRNPG